MEHETVKKIAKDIEDLRGDLLFGGERYDEGEIESLDDCCGETQRKWISALAYLELAHNAILDSYDIEMRHRREQRRRDQ